MQRTFDDLGTPLCEVTFCVIEFVRPMLSVTTSATLKVPGSPKSCWTVLPDALSPSPKSHRYDTIVAFVVVLVVASNRTF